MKKYIIITCIVTMVLSACEREDFCAQQNVTPNLIIRFYDKDTLTNIKKIENLSAIATGKIDSLFTNQTTDSIALPLNTLADKTVYTLVRKKTDTLDSQPEIALLTIEYTSEEQYVSRACGFKIIFKNVTLTKTSWIDSLSTNSIKTINNQTYAHLKLYH